MKKILLLILIVFSSSCSVFVSPPHGFSCPYSDSEISLAKSLFEFGWEEEFQENINEVTRNIAIYCYNESIDKLSGVPYTSGYRDVGGNIHILTNWDNKGEPLPLYKTAFFHELIHSILEVLYNNGDADHGKGSGPWKEEHNFFEKYIRNLYSSIIQ